MDSEKQKPDVEHNPAQNELDLEFNQVEPITPKKVIKAEPSLFDKAKGLFAKKEQTEAHFSRKEPTFSENRASDEIAIETQSELSHNKSEEDIVITAPITNPTATKVSWKNPETWPILQVLPQQHRRLFVTLLALILLLIIFFALKPSTETVQSFEQQNSHVVPIQFQPLDKDQTVENNILDNLNKPQSPNESVTVPVDNTPSHSTLENNTVLPPVVQQPKAEPTQTEQTKVEQPTEVKPQPVKTPPVAQPKAVEKVQTAETPKAVKKPKGAEQAKTVEKPKIEKKVAPVVEAEPAKLAKSKTLTIPQGVSLMQVFRNHNLNIADVNAMTKVAGTGNALSSFKAGDKVQVSVNNQGRVTELRLENGARFIRQADGSYIYKK